MIEANIRLPNLKTLKLLSTGLFRGHGRKNNDNASPTLSLLADMQQYLPNLRSLCFEIESHGNDSGGDYEYALASLFSHPGKSV